MKLPFFFSSSFLFLFSLPGSVAAATNPRLLASLPPGRPSASASFLSSPTGNYAAYFLRRAAAAAGFGDDLCYIQVAETSTGDSRWSSDCVPVNISNDCSLVFSDSGLEILDGGRSAWSIDALSDSPVQNLDLDDEGELRITGADGDLLWKDSDEAQKNQLCGSPGPSAQSIGKGSEMGRVGPSTDGVNGPGIGLPLVDSTPYDSGSLKAVVGWVGTGRALLLCLEFLLGPV